MKLAPNFVHPSSIVGPHERDSFFATVRRADDAATAPWPWSPPVL